jgi:uncharacterized protein YodC (DUF2158 family)
MNENEIRKMVNKVLFESLRPIISENDGLKEHDLVVLLADNEGIKKGTKGTVVFDYESSGMYEVEFFDDNHNTIDVVRVFEGDLEKI